ncbi:MAG: hypothetical protein IPO18_09000 [bacterium]|nr:hypothetical protein [bacterium]
MEQCSHFKQVIPYLVLTRGEGAATRVLCYQRRTKDTEARLGGLWSVGFGGRIGARRIRVRARGARAALLEATVLREMQEETGLEPGAGALRLAGWHQFRCARCFQRALRRGVSRGARCAARQRR